MPAAGWLVPYDTESWPAVSSLYGRPAEELVAAIAERVPLEALDDDTLEAIELGDPDWLWLHLFALACVPGEAEPIEVRATDGWTEVLPTDMAPWPTLGEGDLTVAVAPRSVVGAAVEGPRPTAVTDEDTFRRWLASLPGTTSAAWTAGRLPSPHRHDASPSPWVAQARAALTSAGLPLWDAETTVAPHVYGGTVFVGRGDPPDYCAAEPEPALLWFKGGRWHCWVSPTEMRHRASSSRRFFSWLASFFVFVPPPADTQAAGSCADPTCTSCAAAMHVRTRMV